VYASKSNAIAGAASVRALLRKMAGAGTLTDADIQAEIAKASDGLLFQSESDYPFEFVSADLGMASITQDFVHTALASYVDQDPAADKPMADLFGMSATWQTWKDEAHNCADPNDPAAIPGCDKMRNLEQVLESNLTDLHVYYFGKKGSAGHVDGIGVSVFIVGKAPSGRMLGVRSLAIWT
jgi:Nuclease A inhibitor-like protein